MTAHSALIAAFLAGLLGGLHCMAMCGGWLAALAWRRGGAVAPLVPARTLVLEQTVHQAGRLTTYGLLGAIFGAAGGVALQSAWPALLKVLYVAANLLLLAVAMTIARGTRGVPWLERIGLGAFAHIVPAAGRLQKSRRIGARFLLGMLWGATPCGLVYGVLPIALFAGDAAAGALVMLCFGLGTLPNLGLASIAIARAGPAFRRPAWRYAGALLVAAFALTGLYRALFVPSAIAHGAFCLVS